MGYTTGHKWTKEEEDILRNNYIQKTAKELAILFDVTEASIAHKVERLGLKLPPEIASQRARKAFVKKERVIKNCLWCGKQLPPLLPCKAKTRTFCDRSCGSKYNHKHNPKFWEHRKQFGNREAKSEKRLKHLKEAYSRPEWLKNRSGESSHFWQGGKSQELYGPDFNKRLKNLAKMIWGNRCALCKGTNRLAVHHIDYNKKHNEVNNLVLLCHSCHSKTNKNRKYWEKLFSEQYWGRKETSKWD